MALRPLSRRHSRREGRLMPATIYIESRFLSALEVIKSKPHLARILGKETLATIKAALVIAANDAVTGEGDPDPESTGVSAMGA